MVADSIMAFNTTNVELAKAMLIKDAEVDDLQRKVLLTLKDFMVKSSDFETIQRAVDLIFIARSLERIGDHATNINEDVIFMVHGKDVRHPRTHLFKTE
jgi:phosphate transport system protein